MWAVVIWQNGKQSSQFSEGIISVSYFVMTGGFTLPPDPIQCFHPHLLQTRQLWAEHNKD